MGDVTDIGPMIQLAKLRMKDKKEYDKLLNEIVFVTRDMIKISTSLVKEQMEKMEKEGK